MHHMVGLPTVFDCSSALMQITNVCMQVEQEREYAKQIKEHKLETTDRLLECISVFTYSLCNFYFCVCAFFKVRTRVFIYSSKIHFLNFVCANYSSQSRNILLYYSTKNKSFQHKCSFFKDNNNSKKQLSTCKKCSSLHFIIILLAYSNMNAFVC